MVIQTGKDASSTEIYGLPKPGGKMLNVVHAYAMIQLIKQENWPEHIKEKEFGDKFIEIFREWVNKDRKKFAIAMRDRAKTARV